MADEKGDNAVADKVANGKSADEDRVVVKPEISLLNGVTIIVGIIITSDNFISPQIVLKLSGSPGTSLIDWTVCGLFSLCGALCYGELGTMITMSGGDYAYIVTAFDPLPAFLLLRVTLVIIRPAAQAMIAMTFGQYILQPFFSLECPPPQEPVKILAPNCTTGGKEEGEPECIEQTPTTCVVTAHHNEVSNTTWRDIHAVRNEATHQPAKDDNDEMNVTGEDMTVSCTLDDSITHEEKKRQSANNPCSSFRGQKQSLLHLIMAPAILAGSLVFAAGEVSTEQVIIQVGQHATIPFDIPNSPDDTSQVLSDFSLSFWSKPSPFYVNGEIDIKGFKSPSQLTRFNISVAEMASSICVKVDIDPVDIVDEGRYILIASVQGFGNLRSEVLTKDISVQIPPGPAKCFITISENNNYPYEVHCQATTGSMITTLTCYQYGQRVKFKGDVTENGQVTRKVFLLPNNNPFSCCSHDASDNVNEQMCNDFEWSPSRNSIGSPNVNDTTLTPSVANTVDAFGNTEKEFRADSATCKQYMTSTVSLTIGVMIYLFLCF